MSKELKFPSGLKTPEVEKFAELLRTSQQVQITGTLKSRIVPEGQKLREDQLSPFGYCAMGLLEEFLGYDPEEHGLICHDTLAWLGYNMDEVRDMVMGELEDFEYSLAVDVVYYDSMDKSNTKDPQYIVTMNDEWGLTFSQIGDMVAYFGLAPNLGVYSK